MTTEPTAYDQLANWIAEDGDDLADKWSALLPPLDEASQAFVPTFQGTKLSPQEAGWVFQQWILEAFRLDGANVDPSYRVPISSSQRTMEQIDGLVYFQWQAFLIESKNWGNDVDFTPIALLHERIQRRPPGTMGLVFSSKEFTLAALEATALIRPVRVLLFGRRDLEHVVRERKMVGALHVKWYRAVKYGRPDSPVWEVEN